MSRNKKILSTAVVGLMVFVLGFGAYASSLYQIGDLKADLDAGVDVTGKVVNFQVKEVSENALGAYTVTSEHGYQFMSTENPNIKPYDRAKFRITEYANFFGVMIFTYEVVEQKLAF